MIVDFVVLLVFPLRMNIIIRKEDDSFILEENGSPIHGKMQVEEMVGILNDLKRKYPNQKIWLSYRNVPEWIQEKLEKMIREHNQRIEFDIDR